MITPEQKKQIVLAHGLNPEQYTTDDTGSSFVTVDSSAEENPVAPSISAAPINYEQVTGISPTPQTGSAKSAFGFSALRNALPSAAGGLGAAGTMMGLTGLGLDMTGAGALLGVPLTIAGAGLTAYAAKKAQEKYIEPNLLSPEKLQEINQTEAAHPVATFAGNLATMPLGGFNFNPTGTVKALGAIPKLLTGMGLQGAERNALINAGAGAGIGAGADVAHQLIGGEPFSPSSVLLSALTGGTFTKANRIGNKLGFHNGEDFDIGTEARKYLTKFPDANTIQATPGLQIEDILAAQGAPMTRGLKQTRRETETKTAAFKPAGDAMEEYVANPEPVDNQVSQMADEGGVNTEVQSDLAELKREQIATEIAKQKWQQADIKARIKSSNELNKDEFAAQQKKQAEEDLAYQENERASAGKKIGEVSPEELQKMQEGFKWNVRGERAKGTELPIDSDREFYSEESQINKQAKNDYIGNVDYLSHVEAKDVPKGKVKFHMHNDYGMDTRNGFRYDAKTHTVEWNNEPSPSVKTAVEDYLAKKEGVVNPKHRNPYTKEIYQEQSTPAETGNPEKVDELLQKKLPLNATKKYFELMKQFGVKFKGIDTDLEGMPVDKDGTPVAGATLLQQGLPQLIRLNLSGKGAQAGADTPVHEFKHALINVMRQSDRPADVRFIKGYDKAVIEHPDYHQWKVDRDSKGLPSTPEEYQATVGGYEFLRRIFNSDKESSFSTYKNDLMSYLKTRFGKHADKNDYERMLNYKFMYDKPSVSPKVASLNPNAATTQIEQKDSSNNVRENVNEDILKYAELTKKLQSAKGQDKFNVWQELEDLKNKHGGMPPVNETAVNSEESKLASPDDKRKMSASDYADYLDSLPESVRDNIPEYENSKGFALREARKLLKKDEVIKKVNDSNAFTLSQEYDAIIRIDGEEYGLSKNEDPDDEDLNIWSYTKLKNPQLRMTDTHISADSKDSTPELVKYIREHGETISDKRDPNVGQKNSNLSLIPSFLKPEIDKIRDLPHPDSEKVADAFSENYRFRRQYNGILTNDVVGKLTKELGSFNPKEQYTQDSPDMRAVTEYLYDMKDNGKSDITLTEKQQKIADIVRENLLKSLEEKNKFAGLRNSEADENYIPQMIKQPVLKTLLEDVGTPEWNQLKDDFFQHQAKLGRNPTQAEANWNLLKDSYDKGKATLAQQFGPIDKTAGVGIPRSWREDNLINLMARFNSRYSRRLAYHKAIESQPEVMSTLKELKDATPVKNVLEDISGDREHNEARRMAVSGLIRAGMLGPLTGAKDFVANLTLGAQHLTPFQMISGPLKAMSNMKENIAGTYETGVNRHAIAALEMDESGSDAVFSNLRRMRDVVNTVQGRNWLEKVTRAVAFGTGKMATIENFKDFTNNKASQGQIKFLDDFAPKDWRDKQSLDVSDINEAAARYTESVQGTYDYRGLPSIAQRGTFAPYLSLARWNVEKMNNFQKHVIEPAKQGNWTPLLMQTVGALIGGEAVNQLVQLATGRKEKTPSIGEIAELQKEGEDTDKAISYKLAGLASLSGYFGLYGDILKSGLDVYNHNKPQPYNNPLIEGISTATEDVVDIAEAIRNGDGDLEMVGDAINKVLQDYTQAYRLAAAHLSGDEKENISQANARRDLKVWKNATGQDVSDASFDRVNPLMDRDSKKFKHTDDLGEAVELLPQLISKAIEKADGNIEVLRSELGKIKKNTYQTMPSPKETPISFYRYWQFLQGTKDADKANERLTNYFIQNAKNQVKSSMVPSL